MAKVLKEKIEDIEKLAPDIFKMKIRSPYTVLNAKPGQFVNLKCDDGISALLRRPISICSIDKDTKSFDIVFQVKGTGTDYLSQKSAGSEIDIIAPLGNGFTLTEEYRNIAVVGGGIGIFPLLYLLKESPAEEKRAFLGFRSRDNVVLSDEFSAASDKMFISTDDGSEGHKGLVTDLLESEILIKRPDIIYACGPTPMIRKVAEIAHKNNIKCQVSLEQRMGCGIGACLVCACKTNLGYEWEYSHVCKDGPVFWSNEVIFE